MADSVQMDVHMTLNVCTKSGLEYQPTLNVSEGDPYLIIRAVVLTSAIETKLSEFGITETSS